MAKSQRQKLKLLYLYDILCRETDETHSLSVAQMIEKLDARGVHAERKSIYDDLAVLRSTAVICWWCATATPWATPWPTVPLSCRS